MEVVKHVIVGNIIGLFMVMGAVVGIVGGSLVICAASAAGLLLAGG